MTRLLLVDDELQLLRALDVNLRARGFEVDKAMTGEEALRMAVDTAPDVVILDLGLPGIDGVDVIRGLRTWTDTPIIVLSAREAEQAKVTALDVGADDYVTKPFSMAELLARVRAAVRRTAAGEPTPAVHTPDFAIDLDAKIITAPAGHPIRLTPTEWHIVEILVRNSGRLVTHKDLLHAVWGPQYGRETHYLRVHIAHIRRKLEPDPPRPRYLRTEPGMGYRFAIPPPAARDLAAEEP